MPEKLKCDTGRGMTRGCVDQEIFRVTTRKAEWENIH